MLDDIHKDVAKRPNDPNAYTLGSIGGHNIVIACLPEGDVGNNIAATIATNMISTFPSIRVGFMVGIGGGVPPRVRLGDIVVSIPSGQYPGVVQWDFGKAETGGQFKQIGSLNSPPTSLRTAVSKLRTWHDLRGSSIPEFLETMAEKWPKLAATHLWNESLKDPLTKGDILDRDQSWVEAVVALMFSMLMSLIRLLCGWQVTQQITSPLTASIHKSPPDVRVHYGLIASGNKVVKDAKVRDTVNGRFGGSVLCFEMEAAGLMNNFPCIVIRGICDYADSQKNKSWQEYAAVRAAAFAKELILHVVPEQVELERRVEDILDQIRDNAERTQARLNCQENNEILDWLTPIDYGGRQSDYLCRRQADTGNWLLESKEFQQWVNDPKQTLFCHVDFLDAQFREAHGFSIAYIYCNYQRHDEQRLDDLLMSIVKQLSQYQSPLPEDILTLYKKRKASRTRPSVDEVLKLLYSVVSTLPRVFIVIDALDECQVANSCRDQLLSEMLSLHSSFGINVFATSRNDQNISDYFMAGLSMEIRAHREDVERYLKHQMKHLPNCVQDNQDLQHEIIADILEGVDGMFLLAQLYLGELRDKMTVNRVRTTLKSFKKGRRQRHEVLENAYNNAMTRVNAQMPEMKSLALKVLRWTALAKRQLSAVELQHALAVKTATSELDGDDIPHLRDMVSVCAGLVTVDEGSRIVRLVHYTTQEYLEGAQDRWFKDLEPDMTTVCVTYLSFSAFWTGPCDTTGDEFNKRLQSNPFYHYAAKHWGNHALKDTEPDEAMLNFITNEKAIASSCQVFIDRADSSTPNVRVGVEALHLTAIFGLPKLTRRLIVLQHDLNKADSVRRTPLWYAARREDEGVVEELLAAGADVNAGKERTMTALQIAAVKGNMNIVEMLLAAGAEVYTCYETDALRSAIRNGKIEVAERLLAAGAGISAEKGVSALQQAARYGHLTMVEKLLIAGADVNVKYGNPAICRAAREGHLEIVNRLLAAGADVNAASWKSAIQSASEKGYLDIVKALLAAGADLNAPAGSGKPALQLATERGYSEIANLEQRHILLSLKRRHQGGSWLNGCKYLRVSIEEALCGAALVLLPSWREQDPADQGLFVVDGHVIPRGTQVAGPVYSLFQNQEIFEDPFTYRPEGQLEPNKNLGTTDKKPSRVAMRKALVPFMIGDQSCAGQAMAWTESSLVVACVLWYFDFEKAPGKASKLGENIRLEMGREVPEYKISDIFVAEHDGPNLLFREREDFAQELETKG
ncbi:hypothetical protein QQS21_003806 [Conoideocrella luteorostrata]|uniref:Nucleoside phosphorylase domain-containing protein n=1 Tax=Conoideocrella luteorostrata TaxID=1105319 RepID=A0AAJ0FW09_9HYPO|nr:hypothetical protein QQS21_003806 [Conoideocrella luteorostrata]